MWKGRSTLITVCVGLREYFFEEADQWSTRYEVDKTLKRLKKKQTASKGVETKLMRCGTTACGECHLHTSQHLSTLP